MSEVQEQLEEVEIHIEQAKRAIDVKEAILRLTNNKDYIKVINTGYLEEEAVRLTHLRADYNFKEPEDQETLLKGIDSISFLKQYLMSAVQLGRQAERALEADRETHSELLNEVD